MNFYNPVRYTGGDQQEAARNCTDAAIQRFWATSGARIPMLFTELVARELVATFPEARARIIDDTEQFLAANGLYVFGPPYCACMPILNVQDGARAVNHSTNPAANLKSKDGRDIVFTSVRLGRPFSKDQSDRLTATGAYSRGCMFSVDGSYAGVYVFFGLLRVEWQLCDTWE